MILSRTEQQRELLARSRTIAVVGASPDPDRPSAGVFAYLNARAGVSAVPINPETDVVDGIATFPTLAAYAAACGAPDIVDVFRKRSLSAHIARAAVAIGARSLWFQLGVADGEALRIADEAGLDVVFDACIRVEYRRMDEWVADAERPR